MSNDRKYLSMIGMACRAGRVVSGEMSVEDAVKTGKAYLVVVAADASQNTRKLFHNKCSYYGVPIIETGTREELGHAIGRQFRASIGITDQGLAQAVMRYFSEQTEEIDGR